MTQLSDEQTGLRDSVRSLLVKRSDSAALRTALRTERGFDQALWAVLCDQIGVAALAVPERFGGLGAGPVETHVVLEELGRTLTPSPMLGSAVLAAQLLLALGDDDASARLLPRIAAGESIAAVCWAGTVAPAPDVNPWSAQAAAIRADGPMLTGETFYVLDGDIADVLLVVARDGDGHLVVHEVDPQQDAVTAVHTPSMDLTRRLASVSFHGARGRAVPSSDPEAALALARDRACVALSAEQVGAATRIFERTVEYTKMREQFGRPIGSFQALKHRMADLHVLLESARSASYAAARGELLAAVAKVYCSEAFFTVAAEAIQLHGGIAITWEHDAHLYLKRAHSCAQLFGQPRDHIPRLFAPAGITVDDTPFTSATPALTEETG
jgi:hypothetical protein